jgi:AcrR family transcriptional regulator
MSRAAPARRTYHHGDLRRALVAAATSLLDRHGPSGVTLRGTARAAGVSQAAPYRHFASKEALLAAVAEAAFRGLYDACETAARGGDLRDPGSQLDAVSTAYVRFATRYPARYRLMWAPAPRGRDYPALQAAAASAGIALAGALAACAGEGDPTQTHPPERLLVLWSLLHGLAGLILDEQIPRDVVTTFSTEALVRAAMRVLRDGLFHAGTAPAVRRAR